jgi:hypothetical protein
MDDRPDTHDALPGESASATPAWRPLRMPSRRASTLLASVMLGLGIAVGAAVGPAPEVSLAGNGAEEVAKRLPLMIAELELRQSESATAASPSKHSAGASEEAGVSETASASEAPAKSSGTSTSKEEAQSGAGEEEETGKHESATKKALPPITSVWLIELDGTGFPAAIAAPTSTPFITQTIAQGTMLSGWSALSGAAFASDGALAEPPSSTSVPPLLRTIVQPACPEGEAGAACQPETPGALTTADEFLKATLATITSTPAYKEHGLVVITFATIGLAAQSGLPEGASSATLTYQPPAGVLLLSPFAKAGRSSIAFNATSPRQSLEKLLHG